ncbi:Oidioi.mRNA.OKI2018_I69.chr1.g1857.t1.cds [Oikopleura dioica]|uniref:Oidioi.mRNA.OKI2018_I69.chr1.g1857.t1.cds n=1 Tax=Oikopleura dioica TaxID=34765 RepID=A0ABN7ST32_OIKDI|nr:Oidioi.mRNA.OKI2018_I69.chr1.g1857.t1.cds [Oikopleura dioica]
MTAFHQPSTLNQLELPFEQELGQFDSSYSTQCTPNPLDDIFPSPRSTPTQLGSQLSSQLCFSLDAIETSFNAASPEPPVLQKPGPVDPSPAPVTLSLDSIAPGTIISDGGSNSFELVVENGVRKLVPVMLSSMPAIVKTEMASPPASPDSISSVDLNKKLAQNRKASKRYRDKKKADEKKLLEDVDRLEKEKHRQELMLERKKAKKELLLSLISQKFSRVVYH